MNDPFTYLKSLVVSASSHINGVPFYLFQENKRILGEFLKEFWNYFA